MLSRQQLKAGRWAVISHTSSLGSLDTVSCTKPFSHPSPRITTMISPTLLDVQRNGTTLHLRVDDLTLEEEALTTDTITAGSLYDCHDRERIYAVFTDALGKPVFIDIYLEETATTVSV